MLLKPIQGGGRPWLGLTRLCGHSRLFRAIRGGVAISGYQLDRSEGRHRTGRMVHGESNMTLLRWFAALVMLVSATSVSAAPVMPLNPTFPG